MQEDILEVVCERPQEAMIEIEKIDVVAADGEAAAAAIRQQLETRDYRINRIEKITPSLEDVFVFLVEARGRAHQSEEVAA